LRGVISVLLPVLSYFLGGPVSITEKSDNQLNLFSQP